MPQDLQDWLWRLNSIQQEMERLIPAGNLHVLFTLKVGLHASSTKELETFPFGRALSRVEWHAAKYKDPDTGTLWFDLGRGVLPFVMRWDYDDWSVRNSMPEGVIPCETIGWCRWYYLKGNVHGKAADGAQIANSIFALEDATLEACELAPEAVLRKVGNLSALGCWPTALFYLAMKRLHPLIQAFGTYNPNHPFESEHDPDKDCSFAALNDRLITFSPDLRAATCHAFDLFRHLAETQDQSAPSGDLDFLFGHLDEYKRMSLSDIRTCCAEWEEEATCGRRRLSFHLDSCDSTDSHDMTTFLKEEDDAAQWTGRFSRLTAILCLAADQRGIPSAPIMLYSFETIGGVHRGSTSFSPQRSYRERESLLAQLEGPGFQSLLALKKSLIAEMLAQPDAPRRAVALRQQPAGAKPKTGEKGEPTARSVARKVKRKATKPLTDKAAAVLDLLKALPADRGMKGSDILDALNKRKPPMNFDQSTLTKRIIPELRPHGVKNQRGVGYYIDARPVVAPQ